MSIDNPGPLSLVGKVIKEAVPTKSEMAVAKARELGLPVQELKLDRTTKPIDFKGYPWK